MGNPSTLSLIFDYVKANPMQTATQISQATGLNELTVHRQLSGGYKKISAGTFLRKKVTRSLPPNKDGRIRGSFCYLYFVNPNQNTEVKKVVKKSLQRDPITAALFGELA